MVDKNYAPAEPPMRQDFKPPVKWYEDDDDEYKPEEDVFGSRTSIAETQHRLTGKQEITGLSLADVDNHAKKAKKKDAESFDSLLKFLTSPITQDSNVELLTVRVLLSWLSCQNIDGANHGRASSNTPNGYLQMQKERKATFASFFAALCRYARIQCSLIHGVCKGGNYQPGDTELQECIWVAVRIQGTWQIIHPYWVCRTMIGKQIGGWVKLEADGKTVSKPEASTEGMIQSAFKETYFMPRPNDFKYICLPDEAEWQLLPPEMRIKNREDFLRMPFVLPAFFGLGLSIVTMSCCEYNSQNGITNIVIKCRKSQAFKMIMTYDLFIKETINVDEEMLKIENLPRLVLNSRSEERFSFQIRFPVEGTYKIVFYAGVYGKPLIRVCEFKLNCQKRLENCQLLPINTGIDGWGPGPRTERAGLLLPSHMGGVIPLQPPPTGTQSTRMKPEELENYVHIKFMLDQRSMKNNEFSAVMLSGKNIGTSAGDVAARQALNRNVTCKVDDVNKELNIKATIPDMGEYALLVMAGKRGKAKRSVCNYLLSTLKTSREGVPQRKARKALKTAMSESNLEGLASMIEQCKKVKLDDNDDDVRAAKQRHTFLMVKTHLEDCHKRRNIDWAARTLKEVSKYRHKLALMIETRRAEKLKDQLERLGGFTREIPELNKACEELVYTNNPKDEVLSTMKALFILLDEPSDRLEEWAYIQSQLKHAKEHNVNVLNRMKKISERVIDGKTRRKVGAQLHTYTEAQVRRVSQAAASFYIWVDGVLVALGTEKTDMDVTPTDNV